MLASLGFRWWQHMIVRGLHKNCTAAEVMDSTKNYPYTQVSVTSIRSYHLRQIEQQTISDHNRVCYDNQMRLKGRSLNVLGYIHHRHFYHTASSIMPFSLSSSLDNVAVAVNEGR